MKKFIKIFLIILIICNLSCTVLADENVEDENQTEEADSAESTNTEGTSKPNENEVQQNQEANSTQTNTENNNQNKEEKLTLDQIKLKKSELENKVTKSNEQMEFIEGELSSILVQVEDLQNKIKIKKSEIELLNSQEAVLKDEIDIAQEEVKSISDYYTRQKKLAEDRLVAMQEMGETTYLDVLLNSKSLRDFISNYYLITEIVTTDKELLTSVSKLKNEYELKKASLEAKETELSNAREEKEKISISLENMNLVLNNNMARLSAEDMELHKQIEEYNATIAQLERDILTLSSANGDSIYIGGIMAWPVPGYTRISSEFGTRVHPITGVLKTHTGVDIPAPTGTSFCAANGGVVIKAEYNSAYGNMVVLDHGGGITTLYAHGSAISVEVGQIVRQGDEVLEVGSTGYSTGPHAHFEVRIDGEPVQPLDYITSNNNEGNDTLEVNLNN